MHLRNGNAEREGKKIRLYMDACQSMLNVDMKIKGFLTSTNLGHAEQFRQFT